jgi:hypothetical protein
VADALRAAGDALGARDALDFRLATVDDRDWVAAVKAGYRPVRITGAAARNGNRKWKVVAVLVVQ